MDFVISYILPITSTIIALASIVLSVKVYLRDMPKLQIDIENPQYDCFFGNIVTEDDSEKLHKHRISVCRFRLRNNSSVDIEVNDVVLEIQSEIFRLIPNGSSYWATVYFFTYDPDENKLVPDWNSYIPYCERGIHLPLVVKSYTTFTGYALFYHFPADITGKTKAIIRIRTAIGEVKKKILLLEYNETFPNQEWEDVQQYFRSLGDRT